MSWRLPRVSSWGPKTQADIRHGSIMYLFIDMPPLMHQCLLVAEAKQKHLLLKSALHISLFYAPPFIPPSAGFITREREREGERPSGRVFVGESYPMSKPIIVDRLCFCHCRSFSSLTDAPLACTCPFRTLPTGVRSFVSMGL